MPSLDEYPATIEGIIIGPIPEDFAELICDGQCSIDRTRYKHGWAANPLGQEHIWVCAVCLLPSRIALVNCMLCEEWVYTTLLTDLTNSPDPNTNLRNNFVCPECGG